MNDAIIREKLLKCFSAVFPQLSPSGIAAANAENTSGWDSVAHVTLLTLIGEEFDMDVDFEQFEHAVSFSGFATLIEEIKANA